MIRLERRPDYVVRSLNIENFAIIDHVTLDLEMGVTVLAGKLGLEIDCDALSLLMGSRGTNDLIRQVPINW